MTVIASGRRGGAFNLVALVITFLLVLCLYLYTTALEARLSHLRTLVQHVDQSPEGTDAQNGGGGELEAMSWESPDPDDFAQDDVNSEHFALADGDSPQIFGGWDLSAVSQVDDTASDEAENADGGDVLNEGDFNMADTWKSPSKPEDVYDCRYFEGAKDVLLVIKTGATEAIKKVPIHLLTTTTCVPDFVVYSSAAQTIAGVGIRDALVNVTRKSFDTDSHLSGLYPKIQDYIRRGLDTSELAKEGSWELDRWKNIPMALDAYATYPDKKWFVFIDADTAILWSNLLHMLSRLDDTKPLYLGSPVFIGEGTFGHGGSGYAVSAPALQRIAEKEPSMKEKWEERLGYYCCGDMMFAEALRDAGVELTGALPALQGSSAQSVEYSEWNWCRAPVTFHHTSPLEIEELWRWEQGWLKAKGRQTPILYGDMFYHFVGQYVLSTPSPSSSESPNPSPEATRSSWDNLSEHKKLADSDDGSAHEEGGADSRPHASADACLARCKEEPWCLQWRWQPKTCWLGDKPVLGRPPRVYWDPSGGESTDEMVSGWLEDRLAGYVGKLGKCEEGKEFNINP